MPTLPRGVKKVSMKGKGAWSPAEHPPLAKKVDDPSSRYRRLPHAVVHHERGRIAWPPDTCTASGPPRMLNER